MQALPSPTALGLKLPGIRSFDGPPEHHTVPYLSSSLDGGPHRFPVDFSQVCSSCGTTNTPMWRRSPQGKPLCNACGLQVKSKLQRLPANLDPSLAAPPPNSPAMAPITKTPASERISPAPLGSNEPPPGSCPGDGVCNGQGGKDCCSGCPAFNNKHPGGPPSPEPAAAGSADDKDSASGVGAMACENCGTRTTPLWRRDGEGKVACNACGLYYKLHGSHRPSDMKRPTIKRRKRVPPSTKQDPDDSGEAAPEPKGPKRRKRVSAPPAPAPASVPNASSAGMDALLAASVNAEDASYSPNTSPASYALHSMALALTPSSSSLKLPDLANAAAEASRYDSAAASESSHTALPPLDSIQAYRQNLSELLGQTRQHLHSLNSFLQQGEALLASLDNKQFESNREDRPDHHENNHVQDSFYQRMQALPVYPAVPLRKANGGSLANGASNHDQA